MIEAKKWLDSHVPTCKGKRVLITGATSGIGFFAAKYLAYKGAEVVIACRDQAKAEATKMAILRDVPDAVLSFVYYDQANPESIRSLVASLDKESFFSIILNAGIFKPKKEIALYKDGNSLTFQTNAIGTYLLYSGLSKTHKCRYVFVGSLADRYPPKGDYAKFFHDFGKDYFLNYGVSKRAVMGLYEWIYEEGTIDVTLTHPGIARTDITRGYPKWFLPLANGFMKIFFHPAWKASLGLVLLGSGEGARGSYVVPGDWWHINGYPRIIKGPHKKAKKHLKQLLDLFGETDRV